MYVTPFTSTVASPLRGCELLPTVVTHGATCATVESPGPVLPADMETNTPASAARRVASITNPVSAVVEPLIEKLITSTPSATAWSNAAALSGVKQLGQQTL